MKQGKQAFTLIELLVVICIIAILASMLLPALQNAKESANTATCINNLGQFSKAFQMYATNYNDFMPALTSPLGSGGSTGWEMALFKSSGDATAATTSSLTSSTFRDSSFGKAFYCESDAYEGDISKRRSYSLNNLAHAVHPVLTSNSQLGANGQLLSGNPNGSISGNRTTSVHTASDLIIIGENTSPSNQFGVCSFNSSTTSDTTGTSSAPLQQYDILQRRTSHRTAGILFLDGHVKHVKPNTTYPDDDTSMKNNKIPSTSPKEAFGMWTDCPERKKSSKNSCKGTCYGTN